jgi:hypothetical protein
MDWTISMYLTNWTLTLLSRFSKRKQLVDGIKTRLHLIMLNFLPHCKVGKALVSYIGHGEFRIDL